MTKGFHLVEESHQLEQLIQYFFLLTEKELGSQFGIDNSAVLVERLKTRFAELYEENTDMMPDALGKRHGVNPIFIMALDDALKDKRVPFDQLKDIVLSVYRNMLQGLLEQQRTALESSSDTWSTYVESTKTGNRHLYDNEYFQLEYAVDDDSCIGFNIRKCLYFDIFRKNGRPELGLILCEYDYIMANAMKKWATFQRHETIANGGPHCDFRIYRVQ